MRTGQDGFFEEGKDENGAAVLTPKIGLIPFSYLPQTNNLLAGLKMHRQRYGEFYAVLETAMRRQGTGRTLHGVSEMLKDELKKAFYARYANIQEEGEDGLVRKTIRHAYCAVPVNMLLWLYCLHFDKEESERRYNAIMAFMKEKCRILKYLPGSYGIRDLPITRAMEKMLCSEYMPNCRQIMLLQDVLTVYASMFLCRKDASLVSISERNMPLERILSDVENVVCRLLSICSLYAEAKGLDLFPEKYKELGNGSKVREKNSTAVASPRKGNFAKSHLLVAMPASSAVMLLREAVGCSWGAKNTGSYLKYNELILHTAATMGVTMRYNSPEESISDSRCLSTHFFW